MTIKKTVSADLSRRSFVGACALGAAAVSFNGLCADNPARAAAEEAAAGEETYGYTTCTMCNQVPFCGLRGTIKDGQLVRVDGNPDHPKDKPCLKGLASVQALYDPNRLLYPMRRTNPEKGIGIDPGWERISWDEALDTIADKFNEIKATYGADAVMFSAGDPKENIPALDRLGVLFGSANIAYGRAQCSYALSMANILNFAGGVVALPNAQTKCHIQWGSNIAWSLCTGPKSFKPIVDAKRNGCKFIVVDTRLTPTVSQLADIFLQPRPGTDGALALAMANVIIDENLYNHDFVDNWTHGFEEYREYVAQFTPEVAEEITWVPADKIREAARMWAEAGQGTLWCGPHATVHHTNGVQSTRAILLLDALMGYYDAEGCTKVSGPDPSSGYDYGAPRKFKMLDEMAEHKDARAGVERWPVWSALETHFQNNGLAEYIEEGLIHGGLFLGTNLMCFPQTQKMQEAVAKLDFSVGIDLHLNAPTHDFMDIVLPTCVCWERMAPYKIYGNKLFWNNVVMPPAGEAREDWKILMDLGCRLGYERECFGGDLEAALQQMLDDSGFSVPISVQDLKDALPGCYEIPYEPVEWVPGKYEETGFKTPSGKMEFVSGLLEKLGFDGLPVYEEPSVGPISTPELYEQYPLIMETGSRVPWYVHSKYRHMPWLNQFAPEAAVLMNPIDAEARGLVDGDEVRMFNQLGELHLKVAVSNIQQPGVVELHHGWETANSCELIDTVYDPISGFPSYKDGLCEIVKA